MTEWVESVRGSNYGAVNKDWKITRTTVLDKIKICYDPGGNIIGFFIATK